MCTHPGFMTNCVDNWKWHGGANPMHNNNDPAFMPYILRAPPGFSPSGVDDGKWHGGAKPMQKRLILHSCPAVNSPRNTWFCAK
mmetsp:Transcript_120547/g.221722  ORF Transcript_120547/g.221722 Transcript_120547/m.221722 type:complete len:84 (-) Transcript_120547:114-365(-)